MVTLIVVAGAVVCRNKKHVVWQRLLTAHGNPFSTDAALTGNSFPLTFPASHAAQSGYVDMFSSLKGEPKGRVPSPCVWALTNWVYLMHAPFPSLKPELRCP